MKCVYFSLLYLLVIFCSPINILRLTLEMTSDMDTSLYVYCPLLLYSFNQLEFIYKVQ
jgi:hypothetical protein